MEDNRVRVSTTKQINLAQLDQELGGHGLCGSDTEILAVEGSPVTKKKLAAAIKAHVYIDPNAERIAARAALLERLGITEDEAALLREAGI